MKSQDKLKFCRECGTQIPRDSVFCEECGSRLRSEPSPSPGEAQPQTPPQSEAKRLRPSQKHRLKMGLVGLVLLFVAIFFNPFGLIFLPTNTGDLTLDAINGVARSIGVWLVLLFLANLIGGATAIIASFLPTKFQQKYCSNCKVETEQFQSKVTRKNRLPSNEHPEALEIVTKEYVCDRCGSKTVEKTSVTSSK